MSNRQLTDGKTIKDAVESAKQLKEAQKCADHGYGYAAMLTTFSVISAIAESADNRTSAELQIEYFFQKMPSSKDWLVSKQALTDALTVTLLKDIRNALVHALSLPSSTLKVQLLPPQGTFDRNNYDVAIFPHRFVRSVISALKNIEPTTMVQPFDVSRAGRDITWASASGSGLALYQDLD
ncbi:MAG TPA: hypothetical protein EYP90_03035 [Chromatiaceae bacterium]|nr:hypothetical protein [Chromatiaceae bacterium]HIP73164.1 hypothetical protein [Anaerolineae bacterium]